MASELNQRIENMLQKAQSLTGFAQTNAVTCLEALSRAVEQKSAIFGFEPWHPVHGSIKTSPAEMLLRLKDKKGEALPPYPAIMAFYNNGMTADIDTVLVLCALQQFMQGDEKEISVNISGRSLRDAKFIKAVLPAIEALALPSDRKIIFEIHESAPSEIMSRKVLDLCRKLGIAFAIDDVGLSLNDIFRLSEFEEIADFVKIDRQTVRSHPENRNSLDHVMMMLAATLPAASVVAEGVQSAEHAAEITKWHPGIHYVQGLYLPDRETFANQWAEISAKTAA